MLIFSRDDELPFQQRSAPLVVRGLSHGIETPSTLNISSINLMRGGDNTRIEVDLLISLEVNKIGTLRKKVCFLTPPRRSGTSFRGRHHAVPLNIGSTSLSVSLHWCSHLPPPAALPFTPRNISFPTSLFLKVSVQ